MARLFLRNERSGQLIAEGNFECREDLVLWAIDDGRPMAGANLADMIFEDRDFRDTNFILADLRGAIFADCTLDDVDFTKADLRDVTFIGCTLGKVSFRQSLTWNIKFMGCTEVETPFFADNIEEEEAQPWP